MTEPLTNHLRPKTSATITLRIIKSFEYRVHKTIVLHDIDLESTTVGALKEIGRQVIQTKPGWKQYRSVVLDSLKLYAKAHGSKTSNLIINLDHDELALSDDDAYLADIGFENETEVSFFNKEAFEKFKENPETRWD